MAGQRTSTDVPEASRIFGKLRLARAQLRNWVNEAKENSRARPGPGVIDGGNEGGPASSSPQITFRKIRNAWKRIPYARSCLRSKGARVLIGEIKRVLKPRPGVCCPKRFNDARKVPTGKYITALHFELGGVVRHFTNIWRQASSSPFLLSVLTTIIASLARDRKFSAFDNQRQKTRPLFTAPPTEPPRAIR